MADAQSGLAQWGPLLGAGAQGLVNYFGNQNATDSLVGGNNNAISTQQGIQGQLSGIYGNQRALGSGADSALSAQLGLGGTPDYAAFQNSPGFQGSLALGNQAIERGASANGSLYTPNMLNQLGQYDTTYASQNYNNYIGQLMSAAGLGGQANAGLASGTLSTGTNISQAQQNAGVNKAGGAANASGITSNLIGKIPWSAVGNYLGGSGTSGTGAPTSGGFGEDWNGSSNDLNSILDQYGSTPGSGGTTTYFGDNSNPS